MTSRMSWEEIKQKFPNQCVGLVDVETGINSISIKTAVVKYTNKENKYGVEVLSSSDLLKKARNNEIVREFTALDDYNYLGVMGV